MIRRGGRLGNTVLPVGIPLSGLSPFENTDIPLFRNALREKPCFIVFRNPQRNRL